MKDKFRFRRALSAADETTLKRHFSEVYSEETGVLVDTIFHHFPGMKSEYGFMVEEKASGRTVAAFQLLPWSWQIDGVRLGVAQMSGASTLRPYRRQGLIKELIKRFDQTLTEERFDLAIVGGIGGFYRQFGYCYALPFEYHINLPLPLIPESPGDQGYSFRLAHEADIPYLMGEDEAYRAEFSIASYRDDAVWKFLLGERLHTNYGSEFWLMESQERGEQFYCRIPLQGHFGGSGLLVSEISAGIHEEALEQLLAFCRRKAVAKEKPFVRLNLHNESRVGAMALAMGAEKGRQYAWQIKIPDAARFLMRIAPVLEKRLGESLFRDFSGRLRLDFFKTNLDLSWREGKLTAVSPGEGRCQHTFRVHADLFPILCLGHRSWQELAHIGPDMGPASGSQQTAPLFEALFPGRKSWLYEPV